MAKKVKDSSVSLNISSREVIPSVVYRMNIPNFFTLTGYDGTAFESPTFEFADATWCFRFYSNDTWQRDEKSAERNDYARRSFNAVMIKLNSVIPQNRIFNIVTLLDANGKEYDCRFSSRFFKEDENEDCMEGFHNHKPSFDRRETLCLIIQLFCEKSIVSDAGQLQNITNGALQTTKDEKNCNVTLLLSKRRISSVVCTLKIPNFFILPEYDGTVFESRTLAFANASWCFRFSSYEKWKSEDDIRKEVIYFYPCMVRLDSEIPEQRIFYTITLLNENDKEYQKDSYGTIFKEDNNEYWMTNFNNEESCLHRRDSLTVIIRLFHDKSVEVEADQLQSITQRDTEMLSQDLKNLLLNGKSRDFTLKVAEKEFLVHRDVLMVRSPVFEAMLSHDMAEKNDGFIDVSDCDPRAMEQFLYYVYTGKVDAMNQENVLGLYYIADKYNMTLLKEQCAEFIKKSLSPSIICGAIQLALNHSDTELLKCATEYFLNHTNDILPTVEWMSFMKSNLIAGNELLIKAFKKQNDSK